MHRNVETLIRKSLLDSHQMSHSNQVLDLSCLVMAIYFRRCCVLVPLPMLGLHIIILLRWKIDTGIVVIKPLNTNMTKAWRWKHECLGLARGPQKAGSGHHCLDRYLLSLFRPHFVCQTFSSICSYLPVPPPWESVLKMTQDMGTIWSHQVEFVWLS